MDSTLIEANFRTIIGRTYYFSYLFIREWAIAQGFVPTNKASDHKRIRNFLIMKKKRFVSDLLKSLRSMRNKSDYNILIDIDKIKAENALSIAEKIKVGL